MEGVVTDLGKTFAEKLINGAIEKSRYVFCFTCIAKEFEEEKDKLEAERRTMRQRFRVAIEKDKDIQFNAQFWEENADKLIQDKTQTKQRCLFGFIPDCIWRYKMGRDLTTKIEEIKMLIEKGEKFENIEVAGSLPDVERYSSQYYISFESRELKYKELLDALKDDNNYIIGLHGMAGTGKTTLAKEVGKQLKTLERFDHVIDTTVTFTPNIKKIQDDIAGSLGLDWGDINESDRPKKLWSRLTKGEKILVILDDVWGNLNFDDIGLPNSDNHKGCKVLVTTRYLWVCNKMTSGMPIQLELLSEKDAWSMFKMHADLSNISSKNLLDTGYKITIECKGLPVAIATIASSLKGQKRQEEWDHALKSLQKHVSMGGVDDYLVGIYKCLQFSYDHLKNEKAKRLFLLCSVFLEDAEISIETLIRLSKGVDLFDEGYGSYKDARSQIVVSKNKLLDSCLLLETKEGKVKMHDLVREVAQWMANKEIQTVSLYNKNHRSLVERDKNIKYLLCEGNPRDFFSSRFDGSKLEILIFMMDLCGSFDVPISFFENISGLRVLKLSNKSSDWSTIGRTTSLPQSIQSLTNIRSLIVENVDLGDISVLGSLKRLETLDLVCCKIDELPQEITELEKFQLLNLDRCRIIRSNPFEVIQRCSSLEELYFCNSFSGFCQKITLPTTLERYHLTDNFGIKNSSPSKCVSLQQDCLSEATFKHVMQRAEVLKLERIDKGGWRNLMPEIVPIDEGMNDLIELHLKYDSQLKCLAYTEQVNSQEPNVFSKLVVLELKYMKTLEELCNGPVSFDSMNNLEELTIEYCGNLRSLFKWSPNLCYLKKVTLQSCSTLVSVFDLSTSRSLLLLEKLEIIDCENLKNIITHERRSVDDNTGCNSMFPKLKLVNIEECPQLQFILPFFSSQDFLLLQVITIKSCLKLKYIFGQHQNVKLTSLKGILIDDLPNFIDIFPENHHSISKPQTQLEPIESFSWWSRGCCYYGYKLKGTKNTRIPLVSEDQLQDYSTLMESSSHYHNIWERVQCVSRLSHIMCNVKVMELVNISKIKSVFMLSVASKMLLETLKIKDCAELVHIIVDIGDGRGGGDIVFPKLQELHVVNCEKLEHIFGHIDDHDYPNHINEVTQLHLPALESLVLGSLPSLIGMCVKKFHTTFPLLKKFGLMECSKIHIRSIGDFIVPYYSMISISQKISATIKELRGNMNHFLALKDLKVNSNSKVESIFCLNEVTEEEMNLGLECIELYDLPVMTCLFKGSKNYFALKNLTSIKIVQCEKLEVIFTTSITRCLPQLYYLRIERCKELKHIIEDDLENRTMTNSLSSKICFPKLQIFVVGECNKLKCVFPISICNELPKLKTLIIKEANELQEVFGITSDDQKIEIPTLKIVVFVNLPSLFHAQGIQFQAVPNCFVQNCQNVSLTSTLSTSVDNLIFDTCFDLNDYELRRNLRSLFEQLQEDSKRNNTGSENPKSKTTEDFTAEMEVQAISEEHMLTSSQRLKETQDPSIEEGSASQTRNEPPVQLVDLKQKGIMSNVEDITTLVPNVATITSSKPNVTSFRTSDHKTSSLLEGSTSAAATLSTITETKDEPPIVAPKQKGIEISVEEGTTSTYDKAIASSTLTHLEDEDEKISTPSFSIVNPKLPATKNVDIRDSRDTIAMADTNKLIEEDPLLAFEKLLTGVQSYSIGSLLQELKTLMDSSSDHDHLVSNQESKSKLISLFHGLNQHQGLLPSDVKEFVEKVQNFFNENIIKHDISQQVLNKHNQLLDSKTDLMNKLLSAKSTQTHIESETSTVNDQIHELSLQIDELRKKLKDLENHRDGLKSVANKCDVQKKKLKGECTEWAQQSKELLSALASSEVDAREAERARKLAKECFANLKSSFPIF